MKVLNIGSMNLDYVYRVDHIVQPGETISSQGMNIFLGGKGINQSIALAKAGAEDRRKNRPHDHTDRQGGAELYSSLRRCQSEADT